MIFCYLGCGLAADNLHAQERIVGGREAGKAKLVLKKSKRNILYLIFLIFDLNYRLWVISLAGKLSAFSSLCCQFLLEA